jgi:hypothetical protein
MVLQFSIVPAGGIATALDAILEHAHQDPWVLHLHPAPVHYLVFCASRQHAADVQLGYQRSGGSVDTEMGVLEVDARGIHADQDCEERSRERMEAFVRWIFEMFAPCKVIDHDGERDLSLLASRNPDVLFR